MSLDSDEFNDSHDEDPRLVDLLDRWMSGEKIETESVPSELRTQFNQMVACLGKLDSLAADTGNGAGRTPTDQTSARSSSSSVLPRVFAGYVLEQELGRGGMGVVYLARHQQLGSYFALKTIRASELASDEEVQRFHQEARAAARLRHHRIVSVHDAGECEGTPFLVMHHIDGEPLSDRLKRGSLEVEEALRIIKQVTQATAYLHEQGIVHRDIKPSNIMLDRDGNAYVTDFGLAKVFQDDALQTTTGTVIGTPAYMAPEQAWGTSLLTHRSDIYSIGAVLYQLLTGYTPFPGDNPLDQLISLRDLEPVPPRTRNSKLTREVNQVVLKCLEKNPEDRYQSGEELEADLDRLLLGDPIHLPSRSIGQIMRRWTRREPALVSHLAGFVIVMIFVQLANVTAGRVRAPYSSVVIVLAIWSVLCVFLQRLVNREVRYAKAVWSIVDVVLFTLALGAAEGPVESLVVGYALLIVAASLWFQPRLIWWMTGASVVSYLILLSYRGEPDTPWHYAPMVAGMLTVIGGVMAGLVNRIMWLLRNH